MDILIKSVLAAGVTALILVLSKYTSPKLAGAIGGIPVVFAISYAILMMENKKGDNSFLFGGIWGAVASIVFSVVLILFNIIFAKTYTLNFVIAYIICFIFMLILVNITPQGKK